MGMTLRKVRKYIGPIKPHPDPKATEQRKEEMQKIRLDAEAAYKKIQSLFSPPSDVSFGKFFQKQVEEFQVATKDFEREEVLQMVVDPTNVLIKIEVWIYWILSRFSADFQQILSSGI